MVKRLYITDYALIERLDIEFGEGLNVITGETGAGKSIIMGALALVMGGRGDASAVREGAKKCVVEAEISLEGMEGKMVEEMRKMVDEYDVEESIVLRREMTATGKSRSFVNDTPVSLQTMKGIASAMIDIHSQHQNLLLERKEFQLSLLDTVAGNEKELAEYQNIYKRYGDVSKKVAELRRLIEESEREREYDEFQCKQLTDARIEEGEQERLEEEQTRMEHAEEIKNELNAVSGAMGDEMTGVLTRLKECVQRLNKAGKYVAKYGEMAEAVNERYMDLRELAVDMEKGMNEIFTDEERRVQVEERLSEIYGLEQKHRVQTCEELITLQLELQAKLAGMEERGDELEKMIGEQEKLGKEMRERGLALRKKREGVVGEIEKTMMERLVYLGIVNAKVEIGMSSGECGMYGMDEVEIRFSANKNGVPQNIGKIASGGEMARVMLTIKALMAEKRGLQTIIFDEIDTGVSGEMAGRMGEVMQQVAGRSQVIAITHLPQIAAKGGTHYKVYKEEGEERSVTNIRKLAKEEREMEIAEMLSGKNPSETAVLAARELMNG